MRVTESDAQVAYIAVKSLYKDTDDLLFHGWHHIEFVHAKAPIFARDLGADENLTRICALVHDLNYMAKRHTYSETKEGSALRHQILSSSGLHDETIATIENIIKEAATEKRHANISAPAKALSDADTLFKALPTTPILFASRFLQQTNFNIRKLALKVVSEQLPLFEQDIYFYSDTARRLYLPWAKTNLDLWQGVVAALDDPDVNRLLNQAGLSALLDN